MSLASSRVARGASQLSGRQQLDFLGAVFRDNVGMFLRDGALLSRGLLDGGVTVHQNDVSLVAFDFSTDLDPCIVVSRHQHRSVTAVDRGEHHRNAGAFEGSPWQTTLSFRATF